MQYAQFNDKSRASQNRSPQLSPPLPNMRPPRLHHHPFFLPKPLPSLIHISRRYSSTAPPPSLLKTHNIPAPHLGHIRVLSLNNPRSRNAISRQLLSELSGEIDAVKKEGEDEEARRVESRGRGEEGGVIGAGTRVLIVASELDECFCAGADLKERRGMSGEEYVCLPTYLPNCPPTIAIHPLPLQPRFRNKQANRTANPPTPPPERTTSSPPSATPSPPSPTSQSPPSAPSPPSP